MIAKIILEDVNGLKKAINSTRKKTKNMRPVWDNVSEKVFTFTKGQFTKQGQQFGTRWKPLNPKYAARKAKMYGAGRPILVARGILRSSVVGRGVGSIFKSEPTKLTMGTSLNVGKYNLGLIHDEGAPRANIQPRPIYKGLLENAGFVRQLLEKLKGFLFGDL